ncbi:MAG: hypothetical protein H6735_21605 [Alphaproteobacteria bacterium]|nr:hypothetical protein [Alphaproteobacteria bacterium]
MPVDRQAKIRVRTARYSVPSTWAGLVVRVWLYADKVVAKHGEEVVEHVRQPANGKSIWYPHYLPELVKKPAAVEQVGDLLFAQLGAPFLRVWRLLVDQRGKLAAARSVKPLLQAILNGGEHGVENVGAALERAFAMNGDPLLLTLRPKEPERPPVEIPARLASVRIESTSLQAYRALGGVR